MCTSSGPLPSGDRAATSRKFSHIYHILIAFIGTGDHAATALYAGLITKEAAKIPAEGFIGGQFRHGPLELAGPGLAAVLFGAWAGDTSTPIYGLAADLIATGADVTLVGDLVTPGSPPAPARVQARTTAVTVGVDLGGTGTRLVALDRAGSVQSRLSVSTRHQPAGGVSQLIAELSALIHDAAAGATLDAVGIGASGPVDSDGIIRNDDTLLAYSHIPLTRLITTRLGVPCAIVNDAVAAAIGENTYGAGQHSPALLAITLGTGIGVALLNDETPYRGSDGVHPEAGHIPIPGPPAPCYCGLATCWEQLASRTALDAATGHATGQVAARAAAGDQPSGQIFGRYAEHVGVGLATLTTVFRPARVVLCGSVARYLPLLRPGIDRALARNQPYAWVPPVAAAALGEYSGAIGAAVLARTAGTNSGRCTGPDISLRLW